MENLKIWTNIFILMAFSCLAFSHVDDRTLILTDTESRIEPLLQYFTMEEILDPTFEVNFPKNFQKIVFNGDLFDRGPYDMRLANFMIRLKNKFPNNVDIIWGNRDIGKLRFLADLHKYNTLTDAKYVKFLLHTLGKENLSEVGINLLKQINTPDQQVKFWAKENGMEKSINFHRQEMEQIRGEDIPVSEKEALLDYFDFITNPNRDFLKYISTGKIAHKDGRILYVHGGLPAYSGFVPNQTVKSKNSAEWVTQLNTWAKSSLLELLSQTKTTKSENVEKFVNFIDAVWVEEFQTTLGHENSPIYGTKFKENGSYVLPTEEMLKWYQQDTNLIVIGHNPVGEYPVLMQAKELGLFLLMADVSFADRNAMSTIMISQNGVFLKGHLSNGTRLKTSVSFQENTDIGLMDASGNIIIAKTDEVTSKKITWKLDKRRPIYSVLSNSNFRSPYVRINSELEEQEGYIKAILKKESLNKSKVIDQYHGRIPILISGASSFNDNGDSEQYVKKVLQDLINSFPHDKILFITGGTNSGTVERVLHELAFKNGIPIHGNLVKTANPTVVNTRLNSFSIVGDKWANQIPASLEMVNEGKGFAVFMGGGPHVRDGINLAQQNGISYFLASNIKGASQDLSAGILNSFSSSENLINLLSKEFKISRSNTSRYSIHNKCLKHYSL